MSDGQDEVKLTLPEGLDAAYVFRQVRSMLDSETARDLWRRIESEMSRGEIDAAQTYLKARFTSLQTHVRKELDQFNASLR